MFDALKCWVSPAPPLDDTRWVVLDVESSGLDAQRDRLLAIAAIAVRLDGGPPRIALGDSFEVVLRQPVDAAQPDKANILLHGIGVGAQRRGVRPDAALQSLADFVGASPLVAFHAAFDQTLIDRACQAALGRRLPNPWLDLAPLAEVLHPQVKARALDDWMAHFGIRCAVRHQAAADTLATAELLLMLWPALRAQLARPGFKASAALAAQRRWLPS
ncbi:PolC-type DNA polymerase III [Ideonella sp. A 288]|uniref:3'-5' exonuclease n=1 Tax=Ideonella sp. A 288 TaxID=1962181 RepID=UPI001303197F|nr:3'-5' exonuclease [Ideonella sp. A 288]